MSAQLNKFSFHLFNPTNRFGNYQSRWQQTIRKDAIDRNLKTTTLFASQYGPVFTSRSTFMRSSQDTPLNNNLFKQQRDVIFKNHLENLQTETKFNSSKSKSSNDNDGKSSSDKNEQIKRMETLLKAMLVGGGATFTSLLLSSVMVATATPADEQHKLAVLVDPSEEKEIVAANPFSNNNRLTLYELLKYIFGALVLVPLRMSLLLPAAFWLLVFAKLGVVGLSKEERKKPLVWWRQALFVPVRIILRAMLFIMGFHRVRVSGQLAPATEAPIIVANHITFVDPLVLFYQTFPLIVAKKGVAKLPLIGDVIETVAILVDRTDRASRENTLNEIQDRALTSYSGHDTRPVIIFPEGTTTNGTALICFKVGAFHPGLPVQPVAIRYPSKHFNPSWPPSNENIVEIIFRTLCQFDNHIEISYLPVYVPNEEEKKNPLLYANNVRKVMAKHLQIGITEHSYEDVILMVDAIKDHIPADHVQGFELAKVRDLYQIDLNSAREMMKKFAAMSKSTKDGKLTYEGFCRGLGLPKGDLTERLFMAFDTDGSGHIDFKEFVIGLSAISKNVSFKDTVELTFKALDTNGDGRIDAHEMEKVMKRVFLNIEDEVIENLFKKVDINQDGTISFDEFVQFAELHPEYIKLVEDVMREHNLRNQEKR